MQEQRSDRLPTSQPPLDAPADSRPPDRRRKRRIAAGGGAVVVLAVAIATGVVLTRSGHGRTNPSVAASNGQCPNAQPVKALVTYDASNGQPSTLQTRWEKPVTLDGLPFTANFAYVVPSDPQYAMTPASICFRDAKTADSQGFGYDGNTLAAGSKPGNPGPPAQRICFEQAVSFLQVYGDLGATPQQELQARLPIAKLGAPTNTVIANVLSKFGGNVIEVFANSGGQENPSFVAVTNAVIDGCTAAVRNAAGAVPATAGAHRSASPATVDIAPSAGAGTACAPSAVSRLRIPNTPSGACVIDHVLIAPSDSAWARFHSTPRQPDQQDAIGFARCVSGTWVVVDYGNAYVGCKIVPHALWAELGIDPNECG